MATIRQVFANQQNAQKSKGPVSETGKQTSCQNALKHGLTSKELLLDADQAAVAQRMIDWRPVYQVETPEQEWVFEQLVRSSVRIDRCQEQEQALRRNEIQRAQLCWDEDRINEVEILAEKLSKHPVLVSLRIQRTKQGAEWMIKRWQALGTLFERHGEWTEAQTALVLDLLGTVPEFRDAALPIDDPAALVAREIAKLERRKLQSLDALDAFERDAAECGLPLTPSRAMSNLRRYEATCMRQFQRASKQLQPRLPDPPQAAPQEPTPAASQERTQWNSGQAEPDFAIPRSDQAQSKTHLPRFETVNPRA